MDLSPNKTRIVCTIGPSSDSPEILREMIRAGMNVARLNFSHGAFEEHKRVIGSIRAAAKEEGRRVAILADLPGPKIRIGMLANEPVWLKPGSLIKLTTEECVGDEQRVFVSFSKLPRVVKQGDIIFLSDGLIQLEVVRVEGSDVQCRVIVGGELRSRKGLNLPGIDLGISAFTERDRECLRFALEAGVDAVSQSFVERASDITAVRDAATSLGYNPFVIAKIERSSALDHLDEIIEAADGIMIARGDLGVEIPIERIAVVQKHLIRETNLRAKPVITATQMLESMTDNRRPTRAEATDVANAILDGTDCVMLSEESATGKYPVEAVSVLSRIAASTEPHRPMCGIKDSSPDIKSLISLSVETIFEHSAPAAVFVPTKSGATARSISRFRLPVWIVAVTSHEATCQRLQFTYGVFAVCEPSHPENWRVYVKDWLASHSIKGKFVVLTEGPSSRHSETNHRVEIIEIEGPS
ncbi:MAG: pyruvate kinase [Nitrospirae bacterium]|nr:pyruvate kinase [Nitrospirota bacterium]